MHTDKLRKQKADGILGLSEHPDGLLAKLQSSGKLDQPMFSLCLAMTNGVLVLGGMDAAMHTSDIVWAPLISPVGSDVYLVHVTGIGLNDEPLAEYVVGGVCTGTAADVCGTRTCSRVRVLCTRGRVCCANVVLTAVNVRVCLYVCA